MNTKTIGQKVVEQISAVARGRVIDAVVTSLVEAEINKRATALSKGYEIALGLQRDLRKIQPDIVAFGLDGARTQEAYSKAKLEEKQRTEQRTAKLEKAIDKATESDDFSDLYNFVNSFKPGDKSPEPDQEVAAQ